MASDFTCLGDACSGPGGNTGGVASSGLPFWGGVGTTSYKLLLLLHILAIITAFGPTLLFPMIVRLARTTPGELGAKLAEVPAAINKRLFLPALIAAALFGILLTVDSEKVYDMSKPWVSGAFAIVIALALVSWFLLRPAQRRLVDGLAKGEEGDSLVRSAKATISASGGIIHLGLVALVILMIWKPGQ